MLLIDVYSAFAQKRKLYSYADVAGAFTMLDTLPQELALCILDSLPAQDRAKLSTVSKAYKATTEQEWTDLNLGKVSKVYEALEWIAKKTGKNKRPVRSLKIFDNPSVVKFAGMDPL